MKTEGQEIFEAGLLAIVETARKAFFEGYRQGSTELINDEEDIENAWQDSDIYFACIKAVEMYTGKPFKA